MEPKILEPDLLPDEEADVYLDVSTTLIVVAIDEDSDEVGCFWEVPDRLTTDWYCDRDETGIYATLFLDYDPELDGKIFKAHIVDKLSSSNVEVPFRIHVGGDE